MSLRSISTICLGVLLLTVFSNPASQAFDHQHKAWNGLLQKYVNSDYMVYYQKLKMDVAKDKAHAFNSYLSELSKVTQTEYKTFSREEKMAYLINAYNAFTWKLIIDKYPVESIKKTVGFLRSPWGKDFFNLLDGEITNLKTIEHGYLRPKFNDPRIHAAINCASFSCPILRREAFTPKKLETQLQVAIEDFLKDKLRNQYDPNKGILMLSKVFDWFDEDFEAQEKTVAQYVAKHGPKEAKLAVEKKGRIKYLDYDWALNDASRSKSLAGKN